ncbi:uncharacterized protein LOC5519119 [Nematostella vectensis]|uniref:uncharacterized protein LOC5519119 n=1 Tax=Nematostella vectensis TaxID=45351 RepID=UPI0020775EBA|nr:uncharacterized protein LOC5519119 [Nematostella vectensis]XP_048589669.1 uncharacterized protein LOC5519119 [Nematostella vectensis]
MALLNRKFKEKTTEEIALLSEPQKVVLVDVDEEEDDDESEVYTHHGITLWVSDAVILLVQHLQIFALFLVMSERWGYPRDFIRHLRYIFFVNLDVWEYLKVSKIFSSTYTGSATGFVPSSVLPFTYQYYFIAWVAFIFVVCMTFLGAYLYVLHKRPLYMLLHIARMKRVFCVTVQLMCMPVGIAVARVFHCRRDDQGVVIWNADNDLQCWSMPHYIYVAVALLIGLLLFIAYPINLIRKTRGQVISFNPEKHEGYLQLKEAEYNQGLDILWAVGQFHLFSSFRRMWIYYRPIMFFLKFFLLCFFGASTYYTKTTTKAEKLYLSIPIVLSFVVIMFVMLSSSVSRPPMKRCRAFTFWLIRKFVTELLNLLFNVRFSILLPKLMLVVVAFGFYSIHSSGGAMGALLSLMMLTMLRCLPFRIRSFNFMIIFSLLMNIANAYLGCVVEEYQNDSMVSSLVVHPYPLYALITVNGLWTVVAMAWVIYLLLRYYQVVGQGRPLWPMLSKDGKSMDGETKKYMQAVLRGRHILEKALSSPAIFAPVHELERQIHIINAYCREAEYLEDPTFESLWDLLDELIEAHRALSPQSLFSQSNKKSVRETAKEFMKMMPQMRKRLDQREYDFILMSPLKKRMLLKMYVLGAFVNGRCDKIRYEVEKKVHKSLQKAAQTPSVISSAESFEWDSLYGSKDPYATTDTYGTNSSIGSRPGTSMSSRSVDKLLDAVDYWEEEQDITKRNHDSLDREISQQLVTYDSLPSDSTSSSGSLPGQVNSSQENVRPSISSRPKSAPQRVQEQSGSKASLMTL